MVLIEYVFVVLAIYFFIILIYRSWKVTGSYISKTVNYRLSIASGIISVLAFPVCFYLLNTTYYPLLDQASHILGGGFLSLLYIPLTPLVIYAVVLFLLSITFFFWKKMSGGKPIQNNISLSKVHAETRLSKTTNTIRPKVSRLNGPFMIPVLFAVVLFFGLIYIIVSIAIGIHYGGYNGM